MDKNNLKPSIIEAVGQTPLVELKRIAGNNSGRLFGKLEYLNPGFSKKDRFARQVIEDAEAQGLLVKGQTIIELTSGNTGTGLAIVCSVKGYKFIAVMSKGNSVERARMMKALGAEVVLVDQCPGSTPGQVSGYDLEKVEEVTRKLVKEHNAFRADQFENQSNYRSHLLHTGPEILEQSGGIINAFCDFAGTGGSFAGCSEVFKKNNSETLCYIVEPEGAATLSGQPLTRPDHRIQGGGYARQTLTFINKKFVDGFLTINDREAMEASRRLAKEEGIFAGFSSGANVAGALKLMSGPCKGRNIVVIICDSGLKYLSTDLWE